MKFNLLILFILCAFSSEGQDLFTDSFAGVGAPFSLQTIGDNLYVGLFDSNTNGNAYIQKVTFDNPQDKTTVAEAPYAAGFLKMVYSTSTNIMYAGTAASLYKIDLNTTLPVQGEAITSSNTSAQRGLVLNSNYLYFFRNNQIIKIDVNDTSFTETILYSGNSGIILGEITDNQLYFFEQSGGMNNLDLFKIDLSDSSPNPILVSSMNGYSGFVQDAHLNNSFLYATIEASGANRLVKFNLEQSLPITTEFIITPDNSPLGITNYQTDLYYATSSQNIFSLEDENLSVKNIGLNEPRAYPNPINDIIYISNISAPNTSFRITSMTGQKILEGVLQNGQINSSNLSKGIYFLELSGEDSTQVIKVLKN